MGTRHIWFSLKKTDIELESVLNDDIGQVKKEEEEEEDEEEEEEEREKKGRVPTTHLVRLEKNVRRCSICNVRVTLPFGDPSDVRLPVRARDTTLSSLAKTSHDFRRIIDSARQHSPRQLSTIFFQRRVYRDRSFAWGTFYDRFQVYQIFKPNFCLLSLTSLFFYTLT